MNTRPSIRLSLILSYSLFVLIVLSALNLFWFSQQEQVAEMALRNKLKERVRLIATAFDSDDLLADNLNLPPIYTAINTNVRTVYLSSDLEMRYLSDQALSDDQKTAILNLAKEALSGSTVSREVYSQNFTRESLYAAAPVFNSDGKVIGVVCVLLPLDAFEASIASARMTVLGLSFLVALLSMPLGLALSEILTRRLTVAQRLAARVANGDYGLRLPEDGPRELAVLARHLNRMAEKLELQTKARSLVLANVTHELLRPIGGLKVGIDALRAGALKDPVLAEDLLNDMDGTIHRMHTTIEDLALAGRPAGKPLALTLSTIDVERFLKRLASQFRRRAEARQLGIEVHIPPDLPDAIADDVRLNQIMSNLLSNAVKYTPSGGRIVLCAAATETYIRLSVQDTGPGIPDYEIAHVFEPFYRGEGISATQQGMGVGLTIAHHLAIAHGGTIELVSPHEGGLIATLALPLSPVSQS